MAKLRILSKNYSDVSSLTGSADVNNLKTYSRSRVMSINSGLGTQEINMSMDTAASVSSVILGRHTFPEGMTLHIYLYNTTNWTGTPLYEATPLTVTLAEAGSSIIPYGPTNFLWGAVEWGADGLAEEFAPKSNYVHWLPTTITGVLSMKIVIDVPASQSIEIGRLMVGEYVEPTYTISAGHTLSWTESTKQYRAQGGTLRSSVQLPTRKLDFAVNTINAADRSEIQDTLKYAGLRRDLFISLFPDDVDIDKLKDYSGIMKLTKIPSMSEYAPLYYKSKYTMEEV